jgi:hypothetical protein
MNKRVHWWWSLRELKGDNMPIHFSSFFHTPFICHKICVVQENNEGKVGENNQLKN